MIASAVERTNLPVLCGPDERLPKKLMSPSVWAEPADARLHQLLRATPPRKAAQQGDGDLIWYGCSGSDGLSFQMRSEPVLVPDAGSGMRGSEGPTVVRPADGCVVHLLAVDSDGKLGPLPSCSDRGLRRVPARWR